MEIKKFTEILKDKALFDYKKMSYKYKDFPEFLSAVSRLYYSPLPLRDFGGENLVFLKNFVQIKNQAIKTLVYNNSTLSYSLIAAENEIISSNLIESICFDRKSVRNILKGFAPVDETENRILGRKKGLEFISDPSNKITEENLYKLYMMTVGDFVADEDRLAEGHLYRHDQVYIISDKVEHSGIDFRLLSEYMSEFIAFINSEDDINDLEKGAIIHFYMSYLHPYFDGNGRMCRMLHLWFLIQRGYSATLFLPFSSLIEKNRNAYYRAFTQVEKNKKLSGVIDVTPFLKYFAENIYNIIPDNTFSSHTMESFAVAVKDGQITDKQRELWNFVLSHYGTGEFSTKDLEKSSGLAAYATIKKFVDDFEAMGLLQARRFSNRVKYKITE